MTLVTAGDARRLALTVTGVAAAPAPELAERVDALGGTVMRPGGRAATGAPVRLVIADDVALMRDGLARLLSDQGFRIVAAVGDAPSLHRSVERLHPDAAIVDIRMPPTHTDEGLVAAQEIRERHPSVGVLLLSHHLAARYATRLLGEYPERVRLPAQGPRRRRRRARRRAAPDR